MLRYRLVAQPRVRGTTQVYLHAHLALKEAALAKLSPYEGEKADRFRPDDKLLAFLNAL